MPVNLEMRGPVALITIDYPPANALSQKCARDLAQAVARCNEQPQVRALVITGAGEKIFVGGADLNELDGFDSSAGAEAVRRVKELFDLLRGGPKPVVAAINGVAAGGGLELALACDFRLAADSARLGVPEVKLGVLPGAGGTQVLPRVVGPAAALEMMLLGGLLDAQRALGLGLVHHVHPAPSLLSESLELAQRLAAMPPLAVAEIKAAVMDSMSLPLAQGLERETGRFARLCASADKSEGVAAFKQGRPPQFTGS
ncbi:MAG: enoyl-CoA hydratase/isomerase family protein [Proteobacteria bacterium]|nr:enoyl-CoA hydratase/isomerase family protein [Pseudomonadota bacterium]MBU1451626.1 enoyl-CoA hydratase/isomerase family protein [Pseudomonadota bacterium]MBU2469289.1 enoyl-CoA hydratase/isomerase family protein [Pseudomonadota bacterium]MBU2517999.1 enoyl-CoA hydratase/isomerase family protein [Pseudomonadota bacterium]